MNLRIIISAFTFLLILGCQETVKHELSKPEIPGNLDSLNKSEAINLNDTVKILLIVVTPTSVGKSHKTQAE